MKKLRKDPYPNPIDTNRYPQLASLDEDLRREAAGLPVKRSEGDKQFLSEMDSWLEQKAAREESDRVFASLEKKQQSQQRPQRQVSSSRQRKSSERPRSFNHFYALLQAERYEEQESYEQEQKRNEQKWHARRDLVYS